MMIRPCSPIVHSVKQSCDNLNIDLIVINNLTYQWKIYFNPVPNKQAAVFVFSQKNESPKMNLLFISLIPLYQLFHRRKIYI